MVGFVIRLLQLYSVHMNSRVYISPKKQILGWGGVGLRFNSVVFRSDCSGEEGRNPWRILDFSVLTTAAWKK
jgi:hypothetical protein